MPAKPRLSERSRHAWTAGSVRATNQNLTMGSMTVAAHTRTSTTAAAVWS